MGVLKMRVFIEKDEDGEYFAYSPDFKGIFAGGKTQKEVKEKFHQAFESHITFLIRKNSTKSSIWRQFLCS